MFETDQSMVDERLSPAKVKARDVGAVDSWYSTSKCGNISHFEVCGHCNLTLSVVGAEISSIAASEL